MRRANGSGCRSYANCVNSRRSAIALPSSACMTSHRRAYESCNPALAEFREMERSTVFAPNMAMFSLACAVSETRKTVCVRGKLGRTCAPLARFTVAHISLVSANNFSVALVANACPERVCRCSTALAKFQHRRSATQFRPGNFESLSAVSIVSLERARRVSIVLVVDRDRFSFFFLLRCCATDLFTVTGFVRYCPLLIHGTDFARSILLSSFLKEISRLSGKRALRTRRCSALALLFGRFLGSRGSFKAVSAKDTRRTSCTRSKLSGNSISEFPHTN